MASVVLIRELDTLIDPKKLGAMQDFQLGWFWKIFNLLRVAPDFKLPFDDQFWSLTGARTRGYWITQSAPVLACFERQTIAGQTWIWHSGLVRLAEAGSQFGNQPANTSLFDDPEPKKSEIQSIKDLFVLSYKNYPKHVGKDSAEKKFYVKVKQHAKKQKTPLIDYAELVAAKCSEYAEATKRAEIPRQYIPSMARWLNEARWLDDPSEWVVSYKLPGKENGKSRLQRNLETLAEFD